MEWMQKGLLNSIYNTYLLETTHPLSWQWDNVCDLLPTQVVVGVLTVIEVVVDEAAADQKVAATYMAVGGETAEQYNSFLDFPPAWTGYQILILISCLQ